MVYICGGRSISTFTNIRHQAYVVKTQCYPDEIEPYVFSIGINIEKDIPKDKYLITQPTEAVIEFKDFNFKLAIIQELMYMQKLIQPEFDVYEFADWYQGRRIDIEKEGYDYIPEVTQYFKDLPIPMSLADKVTEIYQDGGLHIYMNMFVFSGGAVRCFDIESTEDVKHFPSLKKATLCYAKESVFDELKDMGIDVAWL